MTRSDADGGDDGTSQPTLPVTGVKKSYAVGNAVTLTAKCDGTAPSGGSWNWQTLKQGDNAGAWSSVGGGKNSFEFEIENAEFDGLQAKAVYELPDEQSITSPPVTVNVEGAKSDDDAKDKTGDGSGAGSDSTGANGGGSSGAGVGTGGGSGCMGSSGSGAQSGAVDCTPADGPGAGGSGTANGGAGDNGQGNGPDEAPAGEEVRVSDGHSDFGPRLRNGQIRAQVKDDRDAPPTWRAPEDVTFLPSDTAKKPLPAGFEFVGSEGDEVDMIGQVQEPGVPWLGWNTQDTDLVNGASALTMTLNSVEGPGKVNDFVGAGGFGGGDVKHVFQNAGDSYDIPMRTHEHGYWTFTEAGTYTMDIAFSVTLNDGSTKEGNGTLGFEVGGDAQSGGEVNAGGSVTNVQAAAQPSDAPSEQSSDPSQPAPNPSESAAPTESAGTTGSQGSQDSGTQDDCALPRTGATALGTVSAVGAALIGLGGLAVWMTYRRRQGTLDED